MDIITSLTNPLVKLILKLEKKREREKSESFIVEGIREIGLAAKSGIRVQQLMVNERWDAEALPNFTQSIQANKTIMLSNEVFSKVSYRDGVANALAICSLPTQTLTDLQLPKNALVLILEAIEKPGNLGAIFRTADAAGVDAIILSNPNTDVLNPNTIRASLGSLFTVPFVSDKNELVLTWLQNQGFKIVATWLDATKPHFNVEYTGNVAIVMGSEANGITAFWQQNSNDQVKIPMHGEVDSMNVSTATAVVVYEAVRQRQST